MYAPCSETDSDDNDHEEEASSTSSTEEGSLSLSKVTPRFSRRSEVKTGDKETDKPEEDGEDSKSSERRMAAKINKIDILYRKTSAAATETSIRNSVQLKQRKISAQLKAEGLRKQLQEPQPNRSLRCEKVKKTESGDVKDELSKLSLKLKEIEGRISHNEKRTDSELRKLCLRRQEEIKQMEWKRGSLDYDVHSHDQEYNSRSFPGLQRSSTEYCGVFPQQIYPSVSAEHINQPGYTTKWKSQAKKLFGPRLQKSQSTVLRAASSIPSLLLPHFKSDKKALEYNAMDPSSGSNGSLKNDDSLRYSKSRKSPLRMLGSFVDDKLFRGRLGGKSGKSSADLIASRSGSLTEAALAFETQDPPSRRSLANSGSNRVSTPAQVHCNDDVFEAIRHSPQSDPRVLKKGRKTRAFSTPNTSGEILEITTSPEDTHWAEDCEKVMRPPDHRPEGDGDEEEDECQPVRTEINPEALAEIEAFERMAADFLTKKSNPTT